MAARTNSNRKPNPNRPGANKSKAQLALVDNESETESESEGEQLTARQELLMVEMEPTDRGYLGLIEHLAVWVSEDPAFVAAFRDELEDQIKGAVQTRQREIAKLAETLGMSVAPAAPRPTRSSSTPRTTNPKSDEHQVIIAYLKTQGTAGASGPEIQNQLDCSTATRRTRVNELIEEGSIVMTGNKRSSHYYHRDYAPS